MNELPKEADTFDIIEDALIIITPDGKIFTVEDENQVRHKDLFERIEDKNIQGFIKQIAFGTLMSSKLGQNGYTVLIGSKASSEQGEGYYYKILNLPSEWKKDKDAKDKFIFLLKTFERIPQEIIDKGFALEIRINMPDGQYSEIYYPNEVFKNNSFNAEKEAERIKKMQEELKQGNSNAVNQISR